VCLGLSIKPGDVIVILEQGEAGGWWLGELNGQEGYFPENYCKVRQDQILIKRKFMNFINVAVLV
jgi:hypothetical protein